MGDGIATQHLAHESGKTTPFSLSRGQILEQTCGQMWGLNSRLISLTRISYLHLPPIPN